MNSLFLTNNIVLSFLTKAYEISNRFRKINMKYPIIIIYADKEYFRGSLFVNFVALNSNARSDDVIYEELQKALRSLLHGISVQLLLQQIFWQNLSSHLKTRMGVIVYGFIKAFHQVSVNC